MVSWAVGERRENAFLSPQRPLGLSSTSATWEFGSLGKLHDPGEPELAYLEDRREYCCNPDNVHVWMCSFYKELLYGSVRVSPMPEG